MEQLRILTSNYLINVAFIAWLLAQVIKTVLVLIETKHFEPERLVGAGGMPSAHSALVCSLAVGMSRKMGFSSPEFALALVLAGVVMYDAMGIRRAAGEQAKVLNIMLFNLKNNFWSFRPEDQEGGTAEEEHSLSKEDKELKEYLGHTPLEVLGGALLGIIVAMIMPIV